MTQLQRFLKPKIDGSFMKKIGEKVLIKLKLTLGGHAIQQLEVLPTPCLFHTGD